MSSSTLPKYPPNSKIRSSNPHEHVAILRSEQGLEAADPMTVGDMFLTIIKKFPDRTAICFKESDNVSSNWRKISFAEYYSFALQAAKSFMKLGLGSCCQVAVVGFLTPECLFSYFGAIIAGGITIGLTVRLEGTPEGLIKILNYCKAQFILVEDSTQVERLLQIRGDVPHLKAIVQYSGEVIHKSDGLYDWTEFMKLGSDIEDSVVEERLKQQRADQCVSIVFSSGTTGHYKSILLTHDSLTWSAKMLHAGLSPGVGFGVDRFLVTDSVPFSISVLNLDLYLPLHCGATLYFAPTFSRQGVRESLPTLCQVKPTLFFGSARTFEKIRTILEEDKATTPQSAREFLGLQDCQVLLTAGVAVPIDLLEYFKRLDMPLTEAYGMTENAGGITVNSAQISKIGSVGQPYPGTYVRINKPDHQGSGEVLVFGRQRFMGYMNDDQGTRAAIDDEGWLHTGDIGHLDSDGCLFITGRLNEMIVLSNGHNVALHIEQRIKKEVPFLSNVVLVGDGQDYVCCLVTLKTISNPQTGEPLDQLTPSAQVQISQLGCQCTTVTEIIEERDEAVYGAIQEGINVANRHICYDALDRVKKFTILEKDFSIFGGEIGGTMKLKRHVIKERYTDQICAMYDDGKHKPS